jgi:tRNA(Ile)-lysidine synthase
MIKEFTEYIDRNHLIDKDSKVLMAVSGGIDSVVMATLMVKSGFYCAIAHCNFGLRGEESDQDELFVKTLASELSVDFYNTRFDTANFAKENKVSIQVAARELRYNWFEKLRHEIGYDYIAVAHNLNDNMETILFNLARGTGINGLSGIMIKNGKIVRPLLFATREMINEYAGQENILFREDHTNSETKYSRNKIRHLVVPVLKEINPSLEATISETGNRLQEIQKYFEEKIEEEKKRFLSCEGENIKLKIGDTVNILSNLSVAYEFFKEFGITPHLLNDLLEITSSSSGKQLYTSSHRFVKDRDSIIIIPCNNEPPKPITIKEANDFNKLKFIEAKTFLVDKTFRINRDKDFATLDLSILKFPLTLRVWRSGDFFYPFGMKGSKKVSDYLTDRKYSLIDKEKALVLESDNKIVWLVGERIDSRFCLTNKSREALVLRVDQHQIS